MRYCYGVDLGGTAVKIGFFDGQGRLLARWEIPTRREDGGRSIPADIAGAVLADMARRGLEKGGCLGLGVGIPGQVWPDGTADAENLGWERFPIVSGLADRTGLRVAADNDANAAAMGEYRSGGGRGCRSVLFVTLGTGVGGGMIIDGRSLRGAHEAGGELGHIQVEPGETRLCACGNRGCLEQYASASGCVRLAREALEATEEPSVLRSMGELDARAVWDAARAGDGPALRAADRYCMYLARGLAAAANTVDPEVIVIGGGVSGAGQLLADMTAEHYRRLAFTPCKATPIVIARLGNDAGIYGCAAMALGQFS